jgi:hypothetical protein
VAAVVYPNTIPVVPPVPPPPPGVYNGDYQQAAPVIETETFSPAFGVNETCVWSGTIAGAGTAIIQGSAGTFLFIGNITWSLISDTGYYISGYTYYSCTGVPTRSDPASSTFPLSVDSAGVISGSTTLAGTTYSYSGSLAGVAIKGKYTLTESRGIAMFDTSGDSPGATLQGELDMTP